MTGKLRVVLKLSGEALSEPKSLGYSQSRLFAITQEIAAAHQQSEIIIVVGAGNLVRGASLQNMTIESATADQMGMLATIMNALALQDSLKAQGVDAYATSSLGVGGVMAQFDHRIAQQKLSQGSVVICAGGTGNPFCTTDSAASLRAVMLEADCVLKATKVDGIYDKDPQKYADACRFEKLTFDEVLKRELKVMDLGSFLQCRDYNIPIRVFDMTRPGAITQALQGEPIGTLVS